MKKFAPITKSQLTEKGVQALADRPNATSQYGFGGLSPQQLKIWFDKLATFLSVKINEIFSAFSQGEASEYICLPLDQHGIQCLKDLIDAMLNGDFASNILQVYPSATSDELKSLQQVINQMAIDLSNIISTAETAAETIASEIAKKVATDVYVEFTGFDPSDFAKKSDYDLLASSAVKKTDYASNSGAGVIALDTFSGMYMHGGTNLRIKAATEDQIKNQPYGSASFPITPGNLSFAVQFVTEPLYSARLASLEAAAEGKLYVTNCVSGSGVENPYLTEGALPLAIISKIYSSYDMPTIGSVKIPDDFCSEYSSVLGNPGSYIDLVEGVLRCESTSYAEETGYFTGDCVVEVTEYNDGLSFWGYITLPEDVLNEQVYFIGLPDGEWTISIGNEGQSERVVTLSNPGLSFDREDSARNYLDTFLGTNGTFYYDHEVTEVTEISIDVNFSIYIDLRVEEEYISSSNGTVFELTYMTRTNA